MANSDTVVLGSALLTLGSTTAASILPKEVGGQGALPGPRLLFGTALTFVGLSFLGSFAPAVGKGLAVAIALTAVTYYGVPLADNVFNNHHNPVGTAGDLAGSAGRNASNLPIVGGPYVSNFTQKG